MAKQNASHPPPPREVLVEFLHAMQHTVNPYDRIVPVLRGSSLLQHWFGAAARPAGDIDLEWFPEPDRPERFPEALEHARRLCMHSVSNHGYSDQPPLAFDGDVPVPDDGVNLSLWEYDTPGVRCYTGWRWDDRQLSGFLQIDVAQAGSYDLAAISTETVQFPRAWGEPAQVLAYTPEMLLAAKLSWIVRSVQRTTTAQGEFLDFQGEPKDLFDAQLIVTQGQLRPEVLHNALLAVALEDKLDWNRFDELLDPGLSPPAGAASADWAAFCERYQNLAPQPPAELLQTLTTRLRPLLSELREHLPFLRAIQSEPSNEANLLIYADWLEERADPRADFVRAYSKYQIHRDGSAREPIAARLPELPLPWLYYLCGSPARARDLQHWATSATAVVLSQPPSPPALRVGDLQSPARPWWRFW